MSPRSHMKPVAGTAAALLLWRAPGIDIVELHNHSLTDQPRLFYMHFWATGDGVTLAKALRPALNATALAPTS
ncbi:DUF1259 domain-containing protein [Streptomyces sp. NPDC002573]|uniref:DUF1259 domain-containing protein n=1 Tax=Streptomyces sp. NPDC002573 TaxID=3364651 RepID=UPI0036A25B6D